MSDRPAEPDTIRFRVYYDFASTLCYVAHKVLGRIDDRIRELGVELEWRPLDLTMIVPWDRGDSFTSDVRTAVHNTGLSLGLDVEMPDPWLDSRPASAIALSTGNDSDERRWRDHVFESIFVNRSFDLLTPTLTELAEEIVAPKTLPDDESGVALVEESTQEAIALGVTGVPTLLLDNWLFGGVYDDESMLSILSQLAEQYRDSGTNAVN